MALIECPECKRSVSDKAEKCVNCGYPVLALVSAAAPAEQPMRQGVAQAIENKDSSFLWVVQVLLASGIAGFVASSWWAFGGAFLGLSILVHVPYLGKLVGVALAAAFGVLVYVICQQFEAPPAAGYVLGGLVFLGALGANLAATQHVRDLQASSKAR